MADSTRAETLEASDVRKEKTYPFMTINMECTNKGNAADKKELIISTIKRSSASVIFCQEAPANFKKGIVEQCNHSAYNFVPEDINSSKKHIKVAVMWRKTDFAEWKKVDLTEPSITKIEERLVKHEKFVVTDVKSRVQVSMERSAMVKLTSRVPTEASFLAVSWYRPKEVDEAEASEAFYDLICFVREVCENENLSWFIIGGDLIFDTSKVHLTEVEGVTISCGPSFVPSKDIFVFSVPSMNKLPMTVDITLSEEKPRKIKNESSQNGPELKHVPVVRVLNLSRQDRDTFTEDANKSRTLVKTTNEKDRPEPTPEKTAGTAKVGSRASGTQKKLFEDASSSCSSKSPSVIPDGYVTREDFERLFSLVTRIEAKIDSLTAEVEELKLAPPKEQGSDRESTSLKKE